jgi:putative ABC transport system permease protein
MIRVPGWNQLAAVTAMNLRNLPARLGTSLVAVVGIGGVVAVLVALLSMGEGFRAALDLSGATTSPWCCAAARPTSCRVRFERRGQRDRAGGGHVRRCFRRHRVGEFYTIVDLPMRSTGTSANVPFRGVTLARASGPRGTFASSPAACSSLARTR